MNKNIKLILLIHLLIIFVSSCGNQRHVYSLNKTVKIFKKKIKNKQRNTWSHKELLENKNELKYRYSIAMHTDSIFSIRYQLENIKDLHSVIHKIDLNSKEWKSVQNDIIELILKEENKSMNDTFPLGKQPFELPVFLVKIENYSTLKKLLDRTDITHIEPFNTGIFE